MRSFKGSNSNLSSSSQRQKSKTPRGSALVKSSKDSDVDPLLTSNIKSLKNRSLKQKLTKAKERGLKTLKSIPKENLDCPFKITEESENITEKADKCIEQIEQELTQLKKLTRYKSQATSNSVSSKESPEKLLKLFHNIINSKLDATQTVTQLREILKNNCYTTSRQEQQTQTIEEASRRKSLEYEVKISEMKQSVKGMKEHMMELESLYRNDSEKAARLEEELRVVQQKLVDSQKEQKNLIVCFVSLNNRES
eukprot:TRINITY_DN12696_c0_g1_i5.p1 TRINITY_DN12696_c0_g1~~TRINITY_DN12696_c0_g1_i5.p1  ORF type:complete len:253 (-),score=55.67 TRINITY_DN12696_c0_g1_i5:605-1363(-)